jgi:hypothetical protein
MAKPNVSPNPGMTLGCRQDRGAGLIAVAVITIRFSR